MTGASREPIDESESASSGDPFDLLGVAPSFEIDLQSLKQRVRRRIASLHPDRFTDPVEIDRVTRESARVNAAWKLLEDEELRANLLLVRFGGSAPEADRSLPPEFLQEMLSTRLELEEAIESSDSEEIARLGEWALSMKNELRERVRQGLADLQQGTGDADAVRLDLNVWRYIQRMRDELALASDAPGSEG